MKKVIIIILSILFVILLSIILITNLRNNKPKANIKSAENVLYINNNVKKIDKTEIYYGDETYYISFFEKDDKSYIGVLDQEYKIIAMHEKSILKQIEEIKNNEYKIGYKYKKIVYEIKNKNKDGNTYSYYDALSGEFIKKIKMDR